MASQTPQEPAQPQQPQQPPSGRQALLDRWRAAHPDDQIDDSDDEALFSAIGRDYDDYDRYRQDQSRLKKMFVDNPKAAAFFTAWADGDDPVAMLLRIYGPELKERMDDPDFADQLAEAAKQYARRIADDKEYEDAYNRNFQASLQQMDQAQRQNGWSDEQTTEAFLALQKIVADALYGKFSPESLKMAMDAASHDGDVQRAAAAAEVRGRNQKIDRQRRTASKGDGLPSLAGKPVQAPENPKPADIFDQAMMAQGRRM